MFLFLCLSHCLPSPLSLKLINKIFKKGKLLSEKYKFGGEGQRRKLEGRVLMWRVRDGGVWASTVGTQLKVFLSGIRVVMCKREHAKRKWDSSVCTEGKVARSRESACPVI